MDSLPVSRAAVGVAVTSEEASCPLLLLAGFSIHHALPSQISRRRIADRAPGVKGRQRR
ncbi:unnamed protein product, partial [Nesidiocoris tenuis]